MVITTRPLTVLDPTAEVLPVKGAMAARSDTLNGVTVGLLANGKRNSDALLEAVGELLGQQYTLRGVIARNKGNASRPAPSNLVEELVQRCDVVVTASVS